MPALLGWTIRDLETFPQPLDDTRYELIDGELFVSTQPHWRHQVGATRIIAALFSWNEQRGGGVVIDAPGVIFAEDSAVAPDVVWVSAERTDSLLEEDGKLHAAPDLVVELLSPGSTNQRRDREAKLRLYSRQGVREYWIADWQGRELQIYRRVEAQLALATTLQGSDIVTSPLLPGFAVPLHSFFWQR